MFAALNILGPIYAACLETMRGLLDDLKHSKRKHNLEKMSDFRKVLGQVSSHASEHYFVLKSIIVNNLYGVDIMEEAVEICKLRLFLKLVAQLESYEQIEPLPDIDFNIRTGNTLVGFASIDALKQALEGDLVKLLSFPNIEQSAEAADQAFYTFREMQAKPDIDAHAIAKTKSELQERLEGLRAELDHSLAREYGIRLDDQKAYEQWSASHQPFHWLVEFYGIMLKGGFDVVIGNPPYLESRQVPYSAKFFSTESSSAIHAMCIERSLSLCKRNGNLSMIVPLALVSTQRMTALQKMLEHGRDCWYSNFAWRPSKLFDTVNRALTIFLAAKPRDDGTTFSTAYLKWNSDTRDHLIPCLRYIRCPRDRHDFWVPKLGHNLEVSLLKKYMSVRTTMSDFTGRTQNAVFYRITGGLYWKIFTDFAPVFYVNGVSSSSSRQARFTLADSQHVKPSVAILSSDFFWWWYTITSNLRDLNPSDWRSFPVPESAMNDPKLRELGTQFIADLRSNSKMQVRIQKNTGRTETQLFKVKKSKKIIDEIDKVLAMHYCCNDEEIDYLVNYDIKFRVGITDGVPSVR